MEYNGSTENGCRGLKDWQNDSGIRALDVDQMHLRVDNYAYVFICAWVCLSVDVYMGVWDCVNVHVF